MKSATEKIRLKGHETFILREGWVTKGLLAVKENAGVFQQYSGADALGVGTNMAKAIRYWLKESGLIEERLRQGAFLTELGELILQYDPYIDDDFTLWILHCNVAAKLHTVTSWYLFFNTFEAEEFTKEELISMMKRAILIRTGNDHPSERSVNDDCTALINMYTREHIADYDPEDKKLSPFAKLGLLRRDGVHYHKMQPYRNILNPAVVLYLIQCYFKELNTDSVSIADLLEKEKLPGRMLNLKRVALNEYLDVLAAHDDISVNRTAGLDMVYKNSELSPFEVIAKYYTVQSYKV